MFRVHEAQQAMEPLRKVGILRITHHDLRHFFATICIESGVDIPTVSRWLGHKDGGALAMKTYGHLRREHSIARPEGQLRVHSDECCGYHSLCAGKSLRTKNSTFKYGAEKRRRLT